MLWFKSTFFLCLLAVSRRKTRRNEGISSRWQWNYSRIRQNDRRRILRKRGGNGEAEHIVTMKMRDLQLKEGDGRRVGK
jgi:hypothetical protein